MAKGKNNKSGKSITGRYVDGFVIPISKKNLTSYLRMARLGREVWLEYGALEYRECVGDDLNVKMGLPFSKMAKLKAGETVVFSWIVYKSRAHRDTVNSKVIKDPRIAKMMNNKSMPFDDKRMAYGGFKIKVNE
ncbi:MAG: DUF1428 domain-containing protein [Ignavibacteriae bacterium]|nr:MAG: DUF1428 domain-containing protein [Ignavibacteriota bacterium]